MSCMHELEGHTMNPFRQMFACMVGLLTLAGPAAHASGGWGAVLRDTPMEQFNDEDIRLHIETALKVLNAPPSAAPAQWRNEATGAGASLEVVGEPKVQGYAECRRVRSTSYARTVTASHSSWTACKDAGGRWLVVKVG
jgi:surface antigen